MTQKSTASIHAIREAYDLASNAYAMQFLNELDRKPFDRELLQEFAQLVGTDRPVLDLGCGPGHTTAQLTSLKLHATGIDISPKMIELARQLFPRSFFEVGNLLDLSQPSSSVGGILAFYCIVHLSLDQIDIAFSEMHRVLCENGVALIAFHVGSEVIHAERFLGTEASLDFAFFDPTELESALLRSGFRSVDVRIRDPYESEYPSKRCYIVATKGH